MPENSLEEEPATRPRDFFPGRVEHSAPGRGMPRPYKGAMYCGLACLGHNRSNKGAAHWGLACLGHSRSNKGAV